MKKIKSFANGTKIAINREFQKKEITSKRKFDINEKCEVKVRKRLYSKVGLKEMLEIKVHLRVN